MIGGRESVYFNYWNLSTSEWNIQIRVQTIIFPAQRHAGYKPVEKNSCQAE